MYVDESGDGGKGGSDLLILCGLVIHVDHWLEFIQDFVLLRKKLKQNYGLYMTDELNGRGLLRGTGEFRERGFKVRERIQVYKECLDFLVSHKDKLNLIPVKTDKRRNWKYEDSYATRSWKILIQRFDNYVFKKKSKGLIIGDPNYMEIVRTLSRKMKVYNPLPSKKPGVSWYNSPIKLIIEDPYWRNSKDSYILQLVDLICSALKASVLPSKEAQKRGVNSFFTMLNPILIKEISGDKTGICSLP